MLVVSAAALTLLANPTATNVGFEPLVDGRNDAVVQQLTVEADLEKDDPAKLINLGIAYARLGRTDEARAMFTAAMNCSERANLETATGEWKDSRHLARLALRMLENGEFSATRMAAR